MSGISFHEIYERISHALETRCKTLIDDYEQLSLDQDLCVDWDSDLVKKAMKRIIKEKPFFHIEYQYELNSLTITICRKGYYELIKKE